MVIQARSSSPAVAGHHPEPRPRLGASSGRGGDRPLRGQVQVEDDRLVEEDGPGGRQPEVVHHRGPGDVEVLGGGELTGGVHHVVAEERWTEHVHAEEDQLTGDGIHLGVGGHGRRQRAVEIVDPGPTEVGREGVREPGLDQGQCGPGVADDVGVGRTVDGLGRSGRRHGGHLFGQGPGADPPVAVAGGLAAGQGDGVDHAVAREPVVVGRVGRWRHRVGTVAQQAPLQIGRDHAGQLEFVVVGPFLEHRGEVAFEIRIHHGPCPPVGAPVFGPARRS